MNESTTLFYIKILTSFFHVAPARLYVFARKKERARFHLPYAKVENRITLKKTTR
jgi:hypothetical protein